MPTGTLRVLCGVSCDRAGQRAFGQALALARAKRALCILHCIPAERPFRLRSEGQLDTLRRLRQQAVAAKVDVSLRIEHGDPAETILRIAGRERYNLIVVGRRPRSAVTRQRPASVTEALVRDGHYSILIVPQPRRPLPARSSLTRIVWAVAKSPVTVEAEDAVLRMAAADAVDLILVHVTSPPEGSRRKRGAARATELVTDSSPSTSASWLRAALSDEVKHRMRPGVRVVAGDIADSRLRVASAVQADMIVAGGATSPSRQTTASVESPLIRVLQTTMVPVLVVRAGDAGTYTGTRLRLASAA